jgi:hypothetical protein
MSELLPTHVSTRLRRLTALTACMLPLCALPGGAWAQSVPASLRACAADSDPGRRLDCYDREMKRLLARPARAATAPRRPVESAPEPPAQPALAQRATTPVADGAAPTAAAPAAAKPAPGAHRSSVWKIFGGGNASSSVTAHIVRLDRSPDTMVLHLDNGQVWRQIGRASGDLTLHTGDEVTIAEHLGSYWLSSRYVSDMRVRLDQAQ